MRVARWRWLLVPMVVVVAGCLPRRRVDLPAGLLRTAFGDGATFTVQPPPAGQTGQDVVAALRADNSAPMYQRRAVPVFGVIDCHAGPRCAPVPGAAPGGPARTIWVVLFPDCPTATGRRRAGSVVDAVMGLDGGYMGGNRCEP